MAELIVFPDVEDLVRLHLRDRLAAHPSWTSARVFAATLPATLPPLSVLVRRTGGVPRDLVTDRPRVTLECRSAKTAGQAARLAAFVSAVIAAAGREGELATATLYTATEVSGIYLDPDPVHVTHHRYSATFELAVRGDVV